MKIVLPLLLLAPGAALAESLEAEIARHQMEEEFVALDINRDGYVSSAEAAGFADIVRRFDRSDRNRDGRLSRAEYARLKRVTLAKAPGKAAAGGSAQKKKKPSSAKD